MNNPFNNEFIKAAEKAKNPEKLLETLPEDQQNKIKNILSDKEALNNILKSPEAAAIIKMLSGKGKNE